MNNILSNIFISTKQSMSLFKQVQNQLRSSYEHVRSEYDQSLFEQLLEPQNIVDKKITIMMDDGSEKAFQVYRSQHSNVKGPYKWWIRFHPDVSLDEVKSLSAWMSIKCSTVWIPLWGGKWWIIVNPKELSQTELERLSRAYIWAIAEYIGPTKDVPAPDVNTNGQIMSWMVDEYARITWYRQPGVITWKPLSIGGSKGRTQATSRGGLFALQTYLKSKWETLEWKKIIIQWAGNVWLHFGLLAQEAGAVIIGIWDSKWNIINEEWIDMKKVQDLKSSRKSVVEYSNATRVDDDKKFLTTVCDVLVPAALENQITKDNASQIQTTLILELANGPTTAEADTILTSRDIILLPDVLANAWWVTVSYFEQVQNNMNFYREEDEVNEKLYKIMNEATQAVIEISNEKSITLREWAYVISMKRILEAMKVRGW